MTDGLALADLSPARQADVLAALAAVETAERPVPRSAFRAFQEPALTATLRRCLREAGRVLVTADSGFLSGYDDGIGRRLAAEGIGILPSDDRAVLTLVLLHSIAIPRSQGRARGTSWADGEPVTKDELARSQVPRTTIDGAVRRLRYAGLLGYGQHRTIVPGHQLARLTPAVPAALWENLLLVAQPRGVLADIIRLRRATQQEAGT